MTIKTPSYIVKSRHGIWYFQIQIPKKLLSNNKRQLFRRSLKTTNRILALKRARVWWTRMNESDFDLDNELDEIDNKLQLGKQLFQKLNALDADISNEVDDFLMTLNFTEQEALKYYNDFINDKSVTDIAPPSPSTTNNLNSFLLSDLLDSFILEQSQQWNTDKKESMAKNDYLPILNLFIEIVGDQQSAELTDRHILYYKKLILTYPKNRKKNPQYRDKTLSEIAALQIHEEDIISTATKKKYFGRVSSFLNFLAKNSHSIDTLSKSLKGVFKDKKRARDKRDIFDQSDLEKLFNNDYYFKNKHTSAINYWVPLLGLFTGARINELCQLHTNDIRKVDGIWVININDNEDKRVKTIHSPRSIPINSILIDKLKFLDYVKDLKDKNQTMLFSTVIKTNKGHSDAFSKWFNRYRKKTNVGQEKGEKKVFHSFRHTVMNCFKECGVPEFFALDYIGHESGEKTGYKTYAKTDNITKMKELAELLKYDYIDFNNFKLWKN